MGRMSRVKSVGHESKPSPVRPTWFQEWMTRRTVGGKKDASRAPSRARNWMTPLSTDQHGDGDHDGGRAYRTSRVPRHNSTNGRAKLRRRSLRPSPEHQDPSSQAHRRRGDGFARPNTVFTTHRHRGARGAGARSSEPRKKSSSVGSDSEEEAVPSSGGAWWSKKASPALLLSVEVRNAMGRGGTRKPVGQQRGRGAMAGPGHGVEGGFL